MKLFWKIFSGFIVLGALSGGLFWYGKTNQTETVFESQSVNRDVQVPTAPVEVPEIAQKDEVSVDANVQKEEEVQLESKKETTEIKSEEKKETSEDVAPKSFKIQSALVSFGHESASGRKIDTVVLHSSYNPNGDPYAVGAVRSIWQSYGVAPHYMIARDGTVYQLVSDKDIAYHAGESAMKDGRKNVNDFSIGVEILNTKDDEYTKAQYQATKDLITHLKAKYAIKYVVGHDDIAPGRKTDPWNFDWNKL
ncbi:MAG: N-acetylmuramoyl-L-alanine amidase [Candidatus Moranbacteria bacterium]|nr:N-acetylmuramoyl-L-alanine amidase [Candidatus Moranbacteria bacterium]